MTDPTNLIVLLSDQHARRFAGCYGDEVVRTPHLDAMAESGVLFENAYCNSPICVPSRACLATGRYAHDNGCWDNARPYAGSPDSWGHRMRQAGHRATSIGKLHFRSADDDNGFDDEILPMHVVDGVGMIATIVRDPPTVLTAGDRAIRNAGPLGEGRDGSYLEYDRKITAAAIDWLAKEAGNHDKPWVLFVSLVCPHPPYVCPTEYYELYRSLGEALIPEDYAPGRRPMHPAMEDLRKYQSVSGVYDNETLMRVIASYYGAITYLDDNVGEIVKALRSSAAADNTRLIYCSDHGNAVGQKGMFGKCSMYEESVGIPMIMAGPGIHKGVRSKTNVSLVDLFPTILESTGVEPSPQDDDLPGTSLFRFMDDGAGQDRVVFSEHHSVGTRYAHFMIRSGRWKYIHYLDHPSQLFDLEADPEERIDLHGSANHAEIVSRCQALLNEIVDPGKIDALAKQDQKARLEALADVAEERMKRDLEFNGTPAPGPAN